MFHSDNMPTDMCKVFKRTIEMTFKMTKNVPPFKGVDCKPGRLSCYKLYVT